jgi:predicted ATPase
VPSSQFLIQAKLLREKVASFDAYPYSLPVVKSLDTLRFHPRVTFVVGENGSGKSTLLEAIATAWGFNPEGGTRNFNFSTESTHSGLWQCLRLSKGYKRPKDGFFLRAESFYNLASNIDAMDSEPGPGVPVINSYGGKSLHHQSHGESFFSLMVHRFGGNGLYILDEPEAALSPARQLAMLNRMHQLVSEESQFIIATHSPIIMAYPDAEILMINENGIDKVDYEDTDHYQTTKLFINNYQKMTGSLC